MNVAVNTRFLLADNLEGFGTYTNEILRRITTARPDDRFDFYFDRPFDERFIYSDNVRPHVITPPARHPILFYYWYQLRLRATLKKTRPDVFFSPDGYMPLKSGVPTLLTVHDVAPRRFPEHISGSQWWYYKRFMPRFLEEASHIVTVSQFSQREITELYGVPKRRISVVYNGVSSRFRPLSEGERDAIRQKITGGNPYILYYGALHPRKNVERVVRAFDSYKSTVRSDVQLVLAGRRSWKTKRLVGAIHEARARDSILECGYVPLDDLTALVGAATAVCYVSLYEGFGLPVIESMACGTPVITSNAQSTGAVLAEVAGDAAMLVDPLDTEEIAVAMQRIVEDHSLQHSLRGKGLERARKFSWDRAAGQTYKILANLKL